MFSLHCGVYKRGCPDVLERQTFVPMESHQFVIDSCGRRARDEAEHARKLYGLPISDQGSDFRSDRNEDACWVVQHSGGDALSR